MTRTLRMGRAAIKRAFTLIELIVVIVIIGILAAVAAVSYNSFIGNANDTALEATAQQVQKVYQADSAFQNVAIDTAGTPAFSLSSAADADATASGATHSLSGTVVTVTKDGKTCTIDYASKTAGQAGTVDCTQ